MEHGNEPFQAMQEDRDCVICLSPVNLNQGRAAARLDCNHIFHLNCVGTTFNAIGCMKCPCCRHESKGVWSYSNGHIWAANREDGTRYIGRSSEVQPSSEQRGPPTTLQDLGILVEPMSPGLPSDNLRASLFVPELNGLTVEPMSPGLPSDNLQASLFVSEWNGLTVEPMSPGLPSDNLQASLFVPELNGLTVEPMSPGLPSDNLQASLFVPERNDLTMPSINLQYSGNFTTGIDVAAASYGLLGSSYHTNVRHEYPFDPLPTFGSHATGVLSAPLATFGSLEFPQLRGSEVHPDALEHQRSEYRNVSDVQPASASREWWPHNVHRVSSRQEAAGAERLATQHRPGESSSSTQQGGSSRRRRFF